MLNSEIRYNFHFIAHKNTKRACARTRRSCTTLTLALKQTVLQRLEATVEWNKTTTMSADSSYNKISYKVQKSSSS